MSYEMYTEEGNRMVAQVVDHARRNHWTWRMTYDALRQLARNHPDVAREALDTAVRESVYTAIGAYEREEEFYI